MVTGIVLVNVERRLLKQVVDALMAMDGVTEVYTIAGEYDLAVMVRVGDHTRLAELVAGRMPHQIDGIIRTKTLVCLDARAKVDLDAVFGAGKK